MNPLFVVPRPPRLDPETRIFTYKSGPTDESAFRLAHGGLVSVIYTAHVPVNCDLTGTLVEEIEREVNKVDPPFSTESVGHLALILGEEIANAMQNGLAGTPVSILLSAFGRNPHRVIELWVDNFLDPELPCALPEKDDVPKMDEILLESHGRGTGIVSVLADGFYRVLLPGFHLLTCVHVCEITVDAGGNPNG